MLNAYELFDERRVTSSNYLDSIEDGISTFLELINLINVTSYSTFFHIV